MILLDHVIPVANVSVNQTSKEKRVKLAQINTMGQTVRYVNVTLTVAKLRYVTKLTANAIAVKDFKDWTVSHVNLVIMDFLIVKLVTVPWLEGSITNVQQMVSAIAEVVLMEKLVIHAKISIMVKIVSLAHATKQML